jgi:hypothetical protein
MHLSLLCVPLSSKHGLLASRSVSSPALQLHMLSSLCCLVRVHFLNLRCCIDIPYDHTAGQESITSASKSGIAGPLSAATSAPHRVERRPPLNARPSLLVYVVYKKNAISRLSSLFLFFPFLYAHGMPRSPPFPYVLLPSTYGSATTPLIT